MKAMVTTIIEPYRNATAARLGLPDTQKMLWIIDVWSVHVSEAFRTFLKGYPHILVLFVPPNCTSKLQPQDVAVQKPFKGAVQAAFRAFQRKRYEAALNDGVLLLMECALRLSVFFSIVHATKTNTQLRRCRQLGQGL